MTDLARAIEAFTRRRLSERLSPGYVAKGETALKHLLRAVEKRLSLPRIPLSAVTREDLIEILSQMRGRGLSDSSLHTYLVTLRVFFEEIVSEGRLLLNPAEGLSLRVRDALPRHVPTREEMQRLLGNLDVSTAAGLRDRAIVELLYGSGLRRGELLALERADVSLPDRTVFIREGKSRKDRAVPLTEEAARWMGEYLKTRPRGDSPRFFLGLRDGHALERTTFHEHFKRIVERAGLPRALTLHCLRHACALHLLEGGADLVAIKNLLGHRRIQTTATYLRLTTGHLARALSRSHPRG